MPPDAPFPLGPWTVDPVAHEVRRDGVAVRLEPKAVAVLAELARRPGAVVTRADLIDAVWPDVVVTDASLTRCVSQLRAALGDDGRDLIETIPTVGYRLHPPAEPESPATAAPPPTAAPAPRRRRPLLALGSALLVGLVAVGVWVSRPPPVTVEYRVDAVGVVEDPEVIVTEGVRDVAGPVAETDGGFRYRRTVEAGDGHAGAFRLTFRGRTTGTDVVLAVTVRRGDEVLADHTTSGATVSEAPEPFSFYALARVDE